MVEIKRTRGGQSFVNRPIGVANTSVGRDKVYAEKAQTASMVSKALFDLVPQQQVAEAEKIAKKISVQDENGNFTEVDVPKSLGRYGREALGEELQRRYSTVVENDGVVRAAEIARESNGNPDAFNQQWTAYTQETLAQIGESGGGDYVDQATATLAQTGARVYQKLAIDRIQQQETEAINAFSVNIQTTADQIQSFTRAQDFDNARRLLNSATSKIQASTLLDDEQKNESIARLERNFRFQAARVLIGDVPVKDLPALQIAFATGRQRDIEKISPEMALVAKDLSDADQSQIAADISIVSTRSKELALQQQKAAELSEVLEKDGAITPDQLKLLSESAQFAELSDNQRNFVYRKAGTYDKDTLNKYKRIVSGGFEAFTDSELLSFAQFHQTNSTRVDSSGARYRANMGLTDEEVFRMDFVNNYRKENGDQNIRSAYALIAAAETDPNMVKGITDAGEKQEVPTKDRSSFEIMDGILEKKFSSLTPQQRKRILPISVEAMKLRQYDLNRAMDDIASHVSENLSKSKYMPRGVRSFDTPEARIGYMEGTKYAELFAGGPEQIGLADNDFEWAINSMLKNYRLDDQYLIGRFGRKDGRQEAFLSPVPGRISQQYGEYILVDKNQVPILKRNGDPILVTTDTFKNQFKKYEIQRSRGLNKRRLDAEAKAKADKDFINNLTPMTYRGAM